MPAQPGLCGTWSETPKTGFLRTRLIFTLTLDQYNVAGTVARPRARPLEMKAHPILTSRLANTLVDIDHLNISVAVLILMLIQEERLTVTGKSKCTKCCITASERLVKAMCG